MGPFPYLPTNKSGDDRTAYTEAAASADLYLHQRCIGCHIVRAGTPRMGYPRAVPVQVLECHRCISDSRDRKRVILVHDPCSECKDLSVLRALHCIGRPVSTSVAYVDRGTHSVSRRHFRSPQAADSRLV